MCSMFLRAVNEWFSVQFGRVAPSYERIDRFLESDDSQRFNNSDNSEVVVCEDQSSSPSYAGCVNLFAPMWQFNTVSLYCIQSRPPLFTITFLCFVGFFNTISRLQFTPDVVRHLIKI
uniref:Uncharacterized protein n=1 Tax=Cacopsylla melanoneura TaxID=428564 RepID=A0A8D8VSV6_9HEMI